VARTHNPRLGTRITGNAGVRLRHLALIRLRCLSRAVDDVPGALPTAADLMAQLGRPASSGREACHVSR